MERFVAIMQKNPGSVTGTVLKIIKRKCLKWKEKNAPKTFDYISTTISWLFLRLYLQDKMTA